MAHARLVASDPPDVCLARAVPLAAATLECASGIIMETAPSTVQLQFSQPVQAVGQGVRVTAPSGRRVERGPAQVTGEQMRVGIDAAETGTYTVTWRVIAQDTHPARGSFAFSVGHSSAASVDANSGAGDVGAVAPLGLALQVVARWLHLIGYALSFSTVLFLLVVLAPAHRTASLVTNTGAADADTHPSQGVAQSGRGRLPGVGVSVTDQPPRPSNGFVPDGTERLIRLLVGTGIVLMLLAEPVALVARGASLGARDMYDVETLADILGSSFGLVLAQRAGAALLLWVLVGLREQAPRGSMWAVLVLAVLVALADGHAGHAISGGHPWLSSGLDALHVMAMAAWIGGLMALVVIWRSTRSSPPAAGDISAGRLLRLFGWLAATALAMVVVSGVALAWLRLGRPGNITTTSYGQTVMVKAGVVCVVGLVARMGTYGRQGDRPYWWRLELSVLAGVVVLAGLLASLPPPQ